MAGIGFLLNKLSRRDNLLGWARAHVCAVILATGPWIITVIAFWTITFSISTYMPLSESMKFTIIIIYNFSFSSVFCGMLTLVATRYIADCIFVKDTSPIPGMLLATIIFSMLTQMPLAAWFYLSYLKMGVHLAVLSIVNYLVITLIWQTSVYLTAIKNYNAVTIAFSSGLLIAVAGSCLLGHFFSINGVMAGFNIGLGCCLSLIVSCILTEYPYPFKFVTGIFEYMGKFRILIFNGLAYNIAIWIDKWVMWFAPDATVTESGLRVNFNYDSAMFMAYLTIIPSLGVFIFSLENTFHEKYLKFYNDINRKVNFAQIKQNQLEMIAALRKSIFNFVVFQGLFTVVVVLLSNELMSALGISLLRVGVFRFGLIGVFFHMLALFLTIVLSYFDCRKQILLTQVVFFSLNGIITYIAMRTDFVYYGLGYLIAAMVTFAVAAVITVNHLVLLPYHTFITNNTSIEA